MLKRTPLERWILQKIQGPGGGAGQLTRAMIEAYHLEKLRETITLASQKSSFYKRALGGFATDRIKSLAALRELPFTTAADIRQNPQGFLCCSQDEISRIVTLESSGTTGLPKRIFFTAVDQELTTDFFHNALTGINQPGEKVLVLLPSVRPGSVGELFVASAGRMGVTTIPHGFVTDPEAALEIIEREQVDTLLGIPVQVLALAAHEAPGANRFKAKVKNVILNTDHIPQAIVDRIQKKWDCRVYNHYAMTEMGLAGGIDCDAFSGLHLREADLLFEIVNPNTGEVLPDGEEGEVAFTTLTRKGMPLIRYRTGDLARFLSEPCGCGTVLKRLAPVKDRVDGRIALTGGGFLSMSMLDEAVFAVSGVLNFQAAISADGASDRLVVNVQSATWAGEETPELVHKAVQSIPVVADHVNKGILALAPVAVDKGPWKLAKRIVVDVRGEENIQ